MVTHTNEGLCLLKEKRAQIHIKHSPEEHCVNVRCSLRCSNVRSIWLISGKRGNIFLNMQPGTMAQIKAGTSAFLPQVWEGDRILWHKHAIWILMIIREQKSNTLYKKSRNCHNNVFQFGYFQIVSVLIGMGTIFRVISVLDGC